MKTNRFLSLAFFAVVLTFLACSSDSNDVATSSSSSGTSLCANEGYDSDISCDNKPSSSSLTSSSSSIIRSCQPHSLGLGYNVLNSGYPNGKEVISYPILDQDKMCQDDIVEFVSASLQDFSQGTGNSIRDFYQNMNFDLKLGASIDIAIFFSASLDASFSVNSSTTASQNYFYSQLRSYRYTQDDRIKNGEISAQNLSKYLSSVLISDLQTKTAAQILDLYGTHVFIQYYKGGSLQANYVYMGSSLTSSEKVAGAVKGSVSKFNASISGGLGSSEEINELQQHMSFNYKSCGGNALEVSGINELGGSYNSWVSSIQSKPELCGIKDFNNSFVSIWDLISAAGSEYASKAMALYTEFERRANERGIYISSVSPQPCAPANNSETHYCSNGFLREYGRVIHKGKTYKTVVIGTQTWMAANLNEERWCDYEVYGGWLCTKHTSGTLYNMIDNILINCPFGWHLPATAEWDALVNFVETDSKCFNCAGKKLKARSGWNNNGNGTDDYGFSALPDGYYLADRDEPWFGDGEFDGVDDVAVWWVANSCNSEAYYSNSLERSFNSCDYRTMTYDSDDIFNRNYNSVVRGYETDSHSVRCVKD